MNRFSWKWFGGIFLSLSMIMLMAFSSMAVTEVQLGEPEYAGWDGSVARWRSVKKAKAYQVKLYEDDDESEVIVKLTVDTNSVDLGPYMTDGVDYYYSVRAVAKTSERAYVTDGQWVNSDSLKASDRGYTGGKWRNYVNGNRYQTKDGSYLGAGWQLIEGSWYYLNQDGYCQTGWLQLADGRYYLGDQGAMVKGWKEIDGSWYYFRDNGSMATGWVMTQPGYWYYLNQDGTMASNTVIEGHQLDETGLWIES